MTNAAPERWTRPRAEMPSMRHLASVVSQALVITLLLTAACSSSSSSSPPDAEPSDGATPTTPADTTAPSVVVWKPEAEWNADALVEGRILLRDGCVYLADDSLPEFVSLIVWPAGTAWNADESAIVLPDGSVATDGSLIRSGGGWLDAESAAHNGVTADFVEAGGIEAVERCMEPSDIGQLALLDVSGSVFVKSTE